MNYIEASKLFKYVDGNLVRTVYRGSKAKIGDIAGTIRNDGYIVVWVEDKIFLAHKLIWIVVHGEDAKGHIDHINHIRSDNRIENLRDVTQQTNKQNMPLYKKNKSGYHGILETKTNKWRAMITVDYKQIGLGTYERKEDAIAARRAAEIKYGFHENHGSE